MRRSTLFVGILSVLHATDLWCQGEDDETTLLQLNTRVQAQPLPFAAHLPSAASLHAESLLASVRQMAHQITGESPEVATAAIESVKDALTLMKPLILEDHQEIQAQINRQWQELQACHSSESHGATAVGDLSGQITTTRECRDAVRVTGESKQELCDLWYNHADQVSFPPCVNEGGAEAVYESTVNIGAWYTDQWAIMVPFRTNCEQASAADDAERARCSTVLGEYDEVFCQHFLSCRLLDACSDHEMAVYNALIEASQAGRYSRQNQWRMISQAECLLDLITGGLGTNTTLDDASMEGCVLDIDVAHLDFVVQVGLVVPGCPLPTDGDPTCPEVQLPEGWTDGAPDLGDDLRNLQVQGCPNNLDASLVPRSTASLRCCTMDGGSCQSGRHPQTITFLDLLTSTGEACAAGTCNGVSDTWCHRELSYAHATSMCAMNGERLCTRAEISASRCCGTGCGFNAQLIWITEVVPHYTALGRGGEAPVLQEIGSTVTAALRCCSMDGNSCQSGNHEETYTFMDGRISTGLHCTNNARSEGWCHEELTQTEAAAMCAENGERLCTITELDAGRCLNTGCGFNGKQIWVLE